MAIQYIKGNSFLHTLDARTKLLIFVSATIVSMIIIEPILLALIFFSLYYLGRQSVNKDQLNSNLRVLVAVLFTFALFQVLFSNAKDARFLFYLIPGREWMPITVQGLVRGVAVFFRFFCVVLSMHLMLYTTPPVEMALTITERGQQRRFLATAGVVAALGLIFFLGAFSSVNASASFLGITHQVAKIAVLSALCLVFAIIALKVVGRGMPPEMGVALMLGFATVNILFTQASQITNAQKARGYDVKPKKLMARVKVLTALLIPIFLATLERSQDISIAILSRGFDYDISKRTYRREFIFRKNDYIVLAILFFVIIGGLMMKQLGVSSPTETFILARLAH